METKCVMPIDKLINGFKQFRHHYYVEQPEVYRKLVKKGQNPDIMVIACADSRVNPSIILQAMPGDLFIVRNIANLVPPNRTRDRGHGTGAAIEFAVKDLNVKKIIVLGHSQCGGIRRLSESKLSAGDREYIDNWVSTALPARPEEVTEANLREAEKNSVTISLDNLLTYPWVKTAVKAGRLEILGWLFDMEIGQLLSYKKGSGWAPLI